MPRKPTGNPTGRPPGSGTLGDHTRLTVRIPSDLYTRLEVFAEGRSFTRGAPELARCVRDALEHFLVCPERRQTKNLPPSVVDRQSQPESVPALSLVTPQASPPVQRPNEPAAVAAVPPFDRLKHHLGKLCRAGHEWGRTGQSLRANNKAGYCLACNAALNVAHKRAARQRQAQRA